MAATQYPVFTIGHSNHSPAAFRALLHKHGVAAVADVRSAPYSRYAPHFNHEVLKDALENQGIAYLFLGGELGGRPADRSCYDDAGRVCYDRVAAADFFAEGLRRIIRNADDGRLALLCTEKEPLECHRTLLVARALTARGLAGKAYPRQRRLGKPRRRNGSTAGAFPPAAQRRSVPFPGGNSCRCLDPASAARGLYSRAAGGCPRPPLTLNWLKDGMKLYTIGFTKKSAAQFFGLLQQSEARRLVDVRLNNVSQLAGFAKQGDLAYFLERICEMEYVHLPQLAPTREILDAYRKGHKDWAAYAGQYLALLAAREVAAAPGLPELLADAVLLCSEAKPDHCHRRLAAEYLAQQWGGVEIVHLG